MTAVQRLQRWAKEAASDSALEIAKNIDLISEALDAREDMGMSMSHKEYGDLVREVNQMQRSAMGMAPWLRETYQELFVPLLIRLPKHHPTARAS